MKHSSATVCPGKSHEPNTAGRKLERQSVLASPTSRAAARSWSVHQVVLPSLWRWPGCPQPAATAFRLRAGQVEMSG